jgi:hypothetical protein
MGYVRLKVTRRMVMAALHDSGSLKVGTCSHRGRIGVQVIVKLTPAYRRCVVELVHGMMYTYRQIV